MRFLVVSLAIVVLSCYGSPNLNPAGDITAVNTPAAGGLEGGASIGSANIIIRDDCDPAEGIVWDGDSWECGAVGGSDGDTLAALSCATHQQPVWDGDSWECVYMPLTVAPLGVGATATTITEGAGCGWGGCSIGLTDACSTDEVLKWDGDSWECAADAGGSSYTAGDGLTLTASDFDVNVGSGLEIISDAVAITDACADGQVLKSTTGAWGCADDDDSGGISGLSTNVVPKATSATTVGDSNITDTGSAITFGVSTDTTGVAYIGSNRVVYMGVGGVGTIDFQHNTNSTATGYINYRGYNGSTTQFRNLVVADGKGATVLTVTGSTKAVDFVGAVKVGTTLQVTSVTTLLSTLNATQNVTIGDNPGADTLTITSIPTINNVPTMNWAVGSSFTSANRNVQLNDTTSAAAGVGGGLTFSGAYTGTTTTNAAYIKAYKSSGTGGNYDFDLLFGVRQDGNGDVTEAMRILANGGGGLTKVNVKDDLYVEDAVQIDGSTTIGDSASADTLNINSKINTHVYYTGSTPGISCGSGGSVSGNDRRGAIVGGDSAASGGCVITFAGSWITDSGPICTATYLASSAPTIAAPRFTAMSVTGFTIVFDAGKSVLFQCDGVL